MGCFPNNEQGAGMLTRALLGTIVREAVYTVVA